ncbi:cell wall-binding repeat-containing protein [Clostridium lundense]|uniref:cell wall-binding repeat-containing protein n=1 Tax=Clostridium lundense TaxID=319475 RepID=UPI0006885285|nr:cell wall-binding repeat-containing protein [Clostridium lundense]
MKKIKSIVASATLAAVLTTTAFNVSAKVDNRLGGSNRYNTAVAIANQIYNGNVDNVILCSGKGPYDALAASLFAKKINAPILLTDSTKDGSKETFEYIQKHLNKSGKVYILGGEYSVNKDIESEIKKLGFNTERLAGKNRFETSSKILNKLTISKGTPVFIVSSAGFADALSVSNISAIKEYPLIMTNKDKLSTELKAELNKIQPSKVYVIGAENLVSQNIVNEVKAINPNLKDNNIIRIAGNNKYETNLLINRAFDLKSSNTVVASGEGFGDALAGSVLAAKLNAPIILTNGKDFSKQQSYLTSTEYTNHYILGLEGSVSKAIESTLNNTVSKTKDGQEFLTKVCSAEEVKSCEMAGSYTIKFSAKDLPAEAQNGFNQVISTVGDTITMDMTGKLQSESDTKMKEEVSSTIKLGGFMAAKPIKFPMWIDMDASKPADPAFKLIYGLPKELTDLTAADPSMAALKGKEYMVLDMSAMDKLDGNSKDVTTPKMDYAKITSFIEKNKSTFEKLGLKYVAGYNPNFNIVTKLGTKTIPDGRTATGYQITLNNETLKAFLAYTGNNALNFVEQKEVMDFIKAYLNVCIDSVDSPNKAKDKAEFEKEFDKGFNEFLANMPANKLAYSKFVEGFSAMELLGKDGIQIKYYLDDKGRTVYEEGVMDFKLDLSKMGDPSVKGTVGMTINFNTSLTKLNDSNITVKMPTLTDSNSMDYFKFLQSTMENAIKTTENVEIK